MIIQDNKEDYKYSYDLIVLWDWEYDYDFIVRLIKEAENKDLKARSFGPGEMEYFARLATEDGIHCRMVVDRASDVYPALVLLLQVLQSQGALLVNDPKAIAWCHDKATMHLELLQRDVAVPYGIIASTNDHPESLSIMALEKLGVPFVIKPSHGGGSEGVILDAESAEDIASAIQTSRTGKVLLQEKVLPVMMGERRGWFRIFYILGQVIPCWWDDLTHLYSVVTTDNLHPSYILKFEEIVCSIANISRMNFFTTEIAVEQNNKLVAVDFVNEMCDLRFQSSHCDGIPDDVIQLVILKLISFLIPPMDAVA